MKKFFTNDKFFLATILIAVVGTIFYGVVGIISYPNNTVTYVFEMLAAVFALCAFISYKFHSKNVMKGMMGAILMAILAFSICNMQNIILTIDSIFAPIGIVLSALLFINHFIINGTRKASPVLIGLNQTLCALIGIHALIWNIGWALRPKDPLTMAASIVIAFAIPCLSISVVYIESRLDAYRLNREAAGWTEETGYPEGYVHEYQKEEN